MAQTKMQERGCSFEAASSGPLEKLIRAANGFVGSARVLAFFQPPSFVVNVSNVQSWHILSTWKLETVSVLVWPDAEYLLVLIERGDGSPYIESMVSTKLALFLDAVTRMHARFVQVKRKSGNPSGARTKSDHQSHSLLGPFCTQDVQTTLHIMYMYIERAAVCGSCGFLDLCNAQKPERGSMRAGFQSCGAKLLQSLSRLKTITFWQFRRLV